MGGYDPRTFIFKYIDSAPKTQRERRVLSGFSKGMHCRFGASFRPVRVQHALTQGFIREVEGSTVDGVFQTLRGRVAVELLGYSPVRDRGDVMASDESLRKAIKRTLFEPLKAKRFSLSICYSERSRPNGSGRQRTVPRSQFHSTIAAELRSAISHVHPLAVNDFVRVRFVEGDRAERWGFRDGTQYLDASLFPHCAAHFDNVRFQGLTADISPHVESDLRGGAVGIDSVWLRGQVASKASKSLTKSRARANGLPLWLIVHSDGHAPHQIIPRRHRPIAVQSCREVLMTTPHAFRRVYWIDRAGWGDLAWMARII